jgi:hypothetical protein
MTISKANFDFLYDMGALLQLENKIIEDKKQKTIFFIAKK